MACNYRPLKEEKYYVRTMVEGDKLLHANNTDSLVVDLLETKLLLNSTISDTRKKSCFICLGIKDHFEFLKISKLNII